MSARHAGAGVGRALRKRNSIRGEALSPRNRKAQDEAEDKPPEAQLGLPLASGLANALYKCFPPDIEGCCFLFWLNML